MQSDDIRALPQTFAPVVRVIDLKAEVSVIVLCQTLFELSEQGLNDPDNVAEMIEKSAELQEVLLKL